MYKIPRIRIPKFQSQLKNINLSVEENELVYGSSIDQFGESIRQLFNRKHIGLCNSGNSALLLSLMSLNIRNMKVLIPVASTCFAIENAVLSSNNVPVYCDLNNIDGNLDVVHAKKLYSQNKFDAIISPNHFGNLSNISKLKDIGVPVIEDCAQSFLSSMNLKSDADIQVLSFYPTKIMNAIDGGAILTDDTNTIEKINDYKYYGDQVVVDNVPRLNLKMNNINASYGLGTLKHILEINEAYIKLFNDYYDIVSEYSNISILKNNSSRLLYKFVLKFDSRNRKRIFDRKMHGNKIETSNELMFLNNQLELYRGANSLVGTTSSIPYYYSLNSNEIGFIKDKLIESLNIVFGL